MDGAIAGVLRLAWKSPAEAQNGNSNSQLLSEIEAVKQSLDVASARFDCQSDPDLLEACIYEMQALAARYRYLTREARRQGLTKDCLQSLKRLE